MRTCELCDKPLVPFSQGDDGHCTNSRCAQCHRRYCTPGGETSPGHGRGSYSREKRPVEKQLAAKRSEP